MLLVLYVALFVPHVLRGANAVEPLLGSLYAKKVAN